MTGTSFRYAGQRQPLLDVTSKQRPEMMRSQPPEALGLKKKKKGIQGRGTPNTMVLKKS